MGGSFKPKKAMPLRRLGIITLVIIILLGVGVVTLRTWYNNNLRPVSSSSEKVYFTVTPGSSIHQIAIKLKSENLIRNSKAFETYVRGNEKYNNLQAGTYVLSPSMNVKVIVAKIASGDVAKNLLTILPSKRIDEIKQAFLDAKYSQSEVDAAFNPSNYQGHPALNSLAAGASLEGYLYPDSFQKQANTPAQTIIRESLDEMQKHLSADILNGFTAQGLTVYQGITLASIVMQETDDADYQPAVAQVFLLRKNQGTPLQSNVTANYAADLAGVARNVNIDSPYNTYLHSGLPPGPIGNVSASALKAVAHPANSDYLFFVAGDDGKIHFSHTSAEHQDMINQYCKEKCAQ